MLYKPFANALLWNTLNVFLYKIMLQTHQVCLFYVISKELFGISGTLFSSIYLLISLTNFGFDYSLFAFHRYYITSQTAFKILMQQFFIRVLTLLVTTLALVYLLHYFAYLPQISFITQYISNSLLIVLVSIFISESLKKTLELFAHLSFLNKAITIVDIITLTGYISIVWSFYFFRGYIDLFIIFMAMCITSWVELTVIIKRLATFYITLPTQKTLDTQLKNKEVLYNQAVNYVNQITKAIFSPNFIIIFLAYHLGMTKAGYIKLIIDIIILLYILLNRAVGIPSGALMSHASGMQQSLLPNFKQTFLTITNGYIQFLYALACTLIFAIGPCLIQATCLNSIMIINILLFTFSGFLEYVIITYEKLYLTQGAAPKLAIINAASLFFLIPTLFYTTLLPTIYILMPFIVIRLCAVAIMVTLAYNIWHILPTFKIHKKTVVACLIIFSSLMLWHFHR